MAICSVDFPLARIRTNASAHLFEQPQCKRWVIHQHRVGSSLTQAGRSELQKVMAARATLHKVRLGQSHSDSVRVGSEAGNKLF
jgi:hypothetical protein